MYCLLTGISIPATVPGGIYSDLMNAGIINSNLYYRFNDEELRWVSFDNWTYTAAFQGMGNSD